MASDAMMIGTTLAHLSWEQNGLLSWAPQRRIPIPLVPFTASCRLLRYPRLAASSYYTDTQTNPPSTSMDNLKGQLEALHLEAEEARTRANAARARFMRLTESIENLRTRAIVDLKSGKEESARQLIAEKQKVMLALEKSKQRAELLEELCNKIGEAISSKEVQLIAALSSATVGLDKSNDTVTSVRIVSPKAEDLASDRAIDVEENRDHTTEEVDRKMNGSNDQDVDALRSTAAADHGQEMNESSEYAVHAMLSARPEMYPDFLLKIDNHLHEAEVSLHGFLSIAAMVLPEDVDTETNKKVATVKQIWHDVLRARVRVRKAVQQANFGQRSTDKA